MIQAIVMGRVAGPPEDFTNRSEGKPYVAFQLWTELDHGGERVKVLAFAPRLVPVARALAEGDAIAVSGVMHVKKYQDRQGIQQTGLDLIAHVITSEHHVAQRRSDMRRAIKPEGQANG